MTPEQKEIGKANFHRVVGKMAEEKPGVTRRDFMKGLIAAGAVAPVAAAAYFGYSNDKFRERPVKAGLIGAGDEGGVLVGEHNPAYLEFIAYSDIRPSNQQRIFKGEPVGPRKGFNFHYGSDAKKKIKLYEDYKKLLENPDIEMVVIALPLHLHAPVVIDALKAGKHVLCEKLMAWNITQCKQMLRCQAEMKDKDNKDLLVAIGHQRHYSLLYAQALEVIKSGVLGDVNHIRALWHRNNALPRLKDGKEEVDPRTGKVILRDSWRPDIKKEDREALEHRIQQLGYDSMEQLVRWRLYLETGGGLMAELGSHQLDACSIFLGKVRPFAVSAIGGKYFYNDDREIEDHVFCTFEFPRIKPGEDRKGRKEKPQHSKKREKDDVVVVMYSSISTNSFEPYGECVMGSQGTLIVESEQQVMLYGAPGRSTSVTVKNSGGGKPALEASGSDPTDRRAVETGKGATGPVVSRGYREEMEHFAYCIRMRQQGYEKDKDELKPRCDGHAAMADAIIALTANQAMRGNKENGYRPERIVFQDEWYNYKSDAVPDADMKPKAT
jgi:predicted dehydrogenase